SSLRNITVNDTANPNSYINYYYNNSDITGNDVRDHVDSGFPRLGILMTGGSSGQDIPGIVYNNYGGGDSYNAQLLDGHGTVAPGATGLRVDFNSNNNNSFPLLVVQGSNASVGPFTWGGTVFQANMGQGGYTFNGLFLGFTNSGVTKFQIDSQGNTTTPGGILAGTG